MASKTLSHEAELVSKVTFMGPESRRGAAHIRRGPGSRRRAGDAELRETPSDPREGCPAQERTGGRDKPHGEPERFFPMSSFVSSARL